MTRGVPLRVAPDYECFPIWLDTESGLDNPDPASIGLSPALSERLVAWSDAFDATLVQDDPVRSGFPTPADEAAFVAAGRALAVEVAREWGERGPVTYYDVSTHDDEPVGF